MTMRDRYYSTYQTIVYKRCFYRAHYADAYKWNIAYSTMLIIVSLGAATLWGVSKTQPILWAFVIGAAQLAQSFAQLLPWATRLNALNYLMPELEKLLIELDADWLSLGLNSCNDSEIQRLITEYEKKYCNLENQYVGTIFFSEHKHVIDAAKKAQKNFLNVRYPTDESKGGEHHV